MYIIICSYNILCVERRKNMVEFHYADAPLASLRRNTLHNV